MKITIKLPGKEEARKISRKAVVGLAQIAVPIVEKTCCKLEQTSDKLALGNRRFAMFAYDMQEALDRNAGK